MNMQEHNQKIEMLGANYKDMTLGQKVKTYAKDNKLVLGLMAAGIATVLGINAYQAAENYIVKKKGLEAEQRQAQIEKLYKPHLKQFF